ncbi:MAG: DUF2971 domain-containing protein [Bacteroidales bacterium]|nr:DUF2971 domain-containing protein [Bacteroidales bacterium]
MKTSYIYDEHKNSDIYRYMNFRKFTKLLEDRALYFNRLDFFQDNEEFTLTKKDRALFYCPEMTDEDKAYWENARRQMYASCWTLNTYPDFMWREYGKGGVAIKSNVSKIERSIVDKERYPIKVGDVNYTDYEKGTSQIPGYPKNVNYIALTKHNKYIQEAEMRLLYSNYDYPKGEEPKGVNISVDLNILIDAIILHPGASLDFKHKIEALLASHGLDLGLIL